MHNSDDDEGNKDISDRRHKHFETINSNDSEEDEVFGIFGIGDKSEGTEMSQLQTKTSKKIRRHDNKGERERNEESEEDEYAKVTGNKVVNINRQILTEHEVLNQIRLREHKIEFLKRKIEENKRKLEKRKGNDHEDKENLDDNDDEWASTIKGEESKRQVALRSQQHWIALKQQREQNVKGLEQDKDTEKMIWVSVMWKYKKRGKKLC